MYNLDEESFENEIAVFEHVCVCACLCLFFTKIIAELSVGCGSSILSYPVRIQLKKTYTTWRYSLKKKVFSEPWKTFRRDWWHFSWNPRGIRRNNIFLLFYFNPIIINRKIRNFFDIVRKFQTKSTRVLLQAFATADGWRATGCLAVNKRTAHVYYPQSRQRWQQIQSLISIRLCRLSSDWTLRFFLRIKY